MSASLLQPLGSRRPVHFRIRRQRTYHDTLYTGLRTQCDIACHCLHLIGRIQKISGSRTDQHVDGNSQRSPSAARTP